MGIAHRCDLGAEYLVEDLPRHLRRSDLGAPVEAAWPIRVARLAVWSRGAGNLCSRQRGTMVDVSRASFIPQCS